AGCDDFLAKPVQIQELFYKLKLHLKLIWICKDNDDFTDSSLSEAELTPPVEIIASLAEYVRIGDLLGLDKQLDIINLNHLECRQFVLKIKRLSSEFRIAEIKNMLSVNSKARQDSSI
ncbi:MAG: hybrid sensor histidine kinase/response regulator, partial [Gammaproteobacteria bacterium]